MGRRLPPTVTSVTPPDCCRHGHRPHQLSRSICCAHPTSPPLPPTSSPRYGRDRMLWSARAGGRPGSAAEVETDAAAAAFQREIQDQDPLHDTYETPATAGTHGSANDLRAMGGGIVPGAGGGKGRRTAEGARHGRRTRTQMRRWSWFTIQFYAVTTTRRRGSTTTCATGTEREGAELAVFVVARRVAIATRTLD